MNISNHYLAGRQVSGGSLAAGMPKGSGGEDFVDSMAKLIALRKSGGGAAAVAAEQEREAILQRMKDPSGDFFRDMKLAAIRAAREKEEEAEEQKAMDALLQIIDNVTGKAQVDRQYQSDWAGVQLGTLEDADPRSPSSLPMLAYLATLGDKGTFEISKEEDEKVRETLQAKIESWNAEMLQRTEGDTPYAGEEEQPQISDEEGRAAL
ncbi:MAG: hypothetical protein K2P20_06450 [Oscillospiraceae bacterium]|nr:hypothetical protein [Oscillospiraceae bacterium]